MCVVKYSLLSRHLTVTAGSSDFVTVIEQRTFDRDTNPRQCINLRINSDTIPEYDEILSVSLETEDEGVTIPISTVNITILDDDGIYNYVNVHTQITLQHMLKSWSFSY